METNLINPDINLYQLLWGIQDEQYKEFKGIKNLREHIDEDKKCIESSIIFPDFNENKFCEWKINSHNNYAFDYVLKLPYHEDLDIYKDIVTSINWIAGGFHDVGCSTIDVLKFYNWLFNKEIKIKDNYLYLPLSNNINLYNNSSVTSHSFDLKINFTDKYIDFLKKLNEKNSEGLYTWIKNGFKNIPKYRIELLYKEYSFSENELMEKLNFNPLLNEQKIIQNNYKTKYVEEKTNQIVNIEFWLNLSIFCLFVYGFEKDDITDIKLSFYINDDTQVTYDMVLKEYIENIYVLEFADPLLYDKLFSEPISNKDIFNKKIINFSKIDSCHIIFKKTNDKSFDFNIGGLNYNYMMIFDGMVGVRYV